MEKLPPPEGRNPLTQHDWTEGVETERKRSINLEISNAMVGLKKQFYGKGPTKARRTSTTTTSSASSRAG